MNSLEYLKIVLYTTSILLIIIGLYAVVIKRNLIKIVLGLSIVDSGVNLLFILMGYISGGTAPIFSPAVMEKIQAGQSVSMVDPVPQALVLTAIVIGFGVTAVALALVIRLYKHHKTTNIDEIRNLKW